MTDFNWMTYFMLVVMAVLGAVAVMPYAFTLNKDKLAQVPLSRRKLVIVSIIQSIVLFAIITFLGLRATKEIGLVVDSAWNSLPIAALLGVLGAISLILIERIVFQPHLPEALTQGEGNIALWKRFAASFYGGISEEILTRLFLVSGIAWLLGHIWETSAGLPTNSVYGAAIVLAALLFGLGHLPATAAITRITPLILVRAIVLNGIIGVLGGWLFWQHGLVAAMVAHFSADIVIHVLGPMLIRPSASPHTTATLPQVS